MGLENVNVNTPVCCAEQPPTDRHGSALEHRESSEIIHLDMVLLVRKDLELKRAMSS